MKNTKKTTVRIIALVALVYFGSNFLFRNDNTLLQIFFVFMIALIALYFSLDLLKSNMNPVSYYKNIVQTYRDSVQEIQTLKELELSIEDTYAAMDKKRKIVYSGIFLFLVLIHIYIIYILALVPGSGLAKELLE